MGWLLLFKVPEVILSNGNAFCFENLMNVVFNKKLIIRQSFSQRSPMRAMLHIKTHNPNRPGRKEWVC